MDINVALNGPQSRAYELLQPGASVCTPWGRGVGKSWFMRRLWYLSVAEHDGKIREGNDNGIHVKTRGVRIVHIQPTFKSCKDIHGDLAEAELGPFGDWEFLGGRINRTEWRIRFPGGSWIQWFGMKEAHANRGLRCDIVTCDESDDIEMSSYDSVVAPWFTEKFAPEHLIRKALLGGTPRRGRYGLLYREHKAGLDKIPGCYTVHATYKDAPEVVDPAYIEVQRQKLAGRPEVFRREYECDFDSAEGLVYGGIWDHDVHVKEPPHGVRWTEFLVGIDHGWEDPGVFILIGVQGSGKDATCWLIDEVHRTKTLESEWCNLARKLQRDHNMRTPGNPGGIPTRWFADPSRPDRIEAFKRAGLWVEAANNAREDGVSAVADRMATRPDPNDKTGKRRISRLYVSPKCKEFIAEVGKYRRRRDPKNPDRILDEIEDGNDHVLDGSRYALFSRFGGPDLRRIETGPGWGNAA